MFKIFDSRKREKVEFIPSKEGRVSFYSCGPTVYNRVHIGNLRAFIFSDLLYRWLKNGCGYDVKWVMNVTDVDDKTIKGACGHVDTEKGEVSNVENLSKLSSFTEKYSKLFFEDLSKVSIEKTSFSALPRATDYIEEMQNLILKIIENGFGYVSDGSVYFDVMKYAEYAKKNGFKYGELGHVDFDNMKETERVEEDNFDTQSKFDFVLWKAKKQGEPFWGFDIVDKKNGEVVSCDGRPGWHIECSAMEKSLFEDYPFDIHSGGVDLCFPHHEDEIAQSRAGYGKDPAKYWVHNEHLMIDGKKMSKSLGNFYTLEDLEEKDFEPEVVRFFLVINSYKKKVNLTDESLSGAKTMLGRLRKNVLKISECGGFPKFAETKKSKERFEKAMNDDLNTPVAIAEIFGFMKKMSKMSALELAKESEDDSLNRKNFVKYVEFVESVFGVNLTA